MNRLSRYSVLLLLLASLVGGGCRSEPASPSPRTDGTDAASSDTPSVASKPSASPSSLPSGGKDKPVSTPPQPISLFDGKTLGKWEPAPLGSERECYVKEGELVIEAGYPISGIRWTEKGLPRTNYEISLEAKRTNGIDFFVGLTFPVADSHCTLIVGGWAGSVVGLSSIDDEDASINESCTLMNFDNDRWYAIRVRVEPKRIQAWIDDERVIDQNIEGRKIGLRNEMLDTVPLGISNFECETVLKNIQLRRLSP